MSHKRIIGLIVLACLFVLVLPFLSTEHESSNVKTIAPEIIVPKVKDNNQAMQEITIEKYDAVAPATEPAAIGEQSDLKPPAIGPVTSLNPRKAKNIKKTKRIKSKKNTKPNTPKTKKTKLKKGWYVQIASLKRSDPIAIESLKSSLRKLNVAIETENVKVRNIKFVRIRTKILANKNAARNERNRINKNLAYDKIQAIIKKRK